MGFKPRKTAGQRVWMARSTKGVSFHKRRPAARRVHEFPGAEAEWFDLRQVTSDAAVVPVRIVVLDD